MLDVDLVCFIPLVAELSHCFTLRKFVAVTHTRQEESSDNLTAGSMLLWSFCPTKIKKGRDPAERQAPAHAGGSILTQ
jgi:hypothetical protein